MTYRPLHSPQVAQASVRSLIASATRCWAGEPTSSGGAPGARNRLSARSIRLEQRLAASGVRLLTAISAFKAKAAAAVSVAETARCIALTPYSRPYDEPKAQNEALARQNRAHRLIRDISPRTKETGGQAYPSASTNNPQMWVA